MRYLKCTEEYGLWYKIGGNLDLKYLKMMTRQEVLMTKKALVVEHSLLIKD